MVILGAAGGPVLDAANAPLECFEAGSWAGEDRLGERGPEQVDRAAPGRLLIEVQMQLGDRLVGHILIRAEREAAAE